MTRVIDQQNAAVVHRRLPTSIMRRLFAAQKKSRVCNPLRRRTLTDFVAALIQYSLLQ
jgi:hypothetical protein